MAAEMRWDEIVRSTSIAYVNHGLTVLSAMIATKFKFQSDVLSSENILILSTALVTFGISVAMRTYRQKKTHNLVEAAREAEPGARFATILNEANEKPIIGT